MTTLFAIITDGNRQIRVSPGETVRVDYRAGAEAGQPVTFDRVLLANGGGESSIGRPALDGATVAAEIVEPEFKGEKLDIVQYRRRKNSRRHIGHRQKYTLVRITSIDVPGLKVAEREDRPAANE
ncbi:MAG TPA: 50S ribosomal protein L21 [Planctomycetaceae bacterium]|nr:50S ribosomal protein L21 [Planctomycetaceae bacterium]